ncbi:MAG: Hsp20 family protein [Candidatus Berkelbacteria bacterium]
MENIESQIENHLREVRKHRKLSQEDLADALGISRQSIIALEQGRSMPSLPLAVSMCKYFNTAFEDLFEFEREIEEEIERSFSDNNIKIINEPITGSGKEKEMLTIEPWRPMREATSLRDAMDRLFEDSVITPSKSVAMPKIDIMEKGDQIVVKAELPGMKEEDISVEIKDNIMTISGEKKDEVEQKEKGYFYRESHSGAFARSFHLPAEVVASKADAEMKAGVLIISVPKVEEKKAQKIEIKKK